jgi:hypothetical protein
VIRPPIASRVEEWDDLSCPRIASFEAIPTAFITVAASQRQVIGIIRTASRLGQHMVYSETHELPSFVSMAILTAAMRTLAYDTLSSRWHCHDGLNVSGRRVRGD